MPGVIVYPLHGVIKKSVEDVVDESLQPARSMPEQVLSGVSISAGGTQEFTVSDTDGYSAVVVTVKATYDA